MCPARLLQGVVFLRHVRSTFLFSSFVQQLGGRFKTLMFKTLETSEPCFFRCVRSTFLFICSTASNPNNFEPQQLEPQKWSKTKRRNKTDVQNLEITLRIRHSPFFGTMRLFFGLHQRVPLHLFRHFATQWMSKNPKGSPFYNFFKSPNQAPLQFFSYFAISWSFTKPEGPPFSILSLRYSADFILCHGTDRS